MTEIKAALSSLERDVMASRGCAPRVSREALEAKVRDVEYITRGTLTLCILTMANGYQAVGKSRPVSADNFIGAEARAFAYEDALREVWPMEGYILREAIAELAR